MGEPLKLIALQQSIASLQFNETDVLWPKVYIITTGYTGYINNWY